jgi:acetylornithine/N-succinyldiaminopimelate aminotransferase
MGEKVKDVLQPGMNGSTFGGNPIVCAGALTIVNRIDDKLLAEVKRKGELIRTLLEGQKGIERVSGLGLMLGVKTVKNENEVVDAMIRSGALPLTAHGGMVRLLPPLTITDEEIRRGMAILLQAAD